MAAKRFLKSSVNWVDFMERIPDKQKTQYLLFKSKCDNYMRRMAALPESPPEINWAMFKKSISDAKLIDDFKKQYESVKIPYPVNTKEQKLSELDKMADSIIADFKKESDARMAEYQKQYDRYVAMPPISEMTNEEFYEYLPEHKIDTENNPTFWPHDEATQVDEDAVLERFFEEQKKAQELEDKQYS